MEVSPRGHTEISFPILPMRRGIHDLIKRILPFISVRLMLLAPKRIDKSGFIWYVN